MKKWSFLSFQGPPKPKGCLEFSRNLPSGSVGSFLLAHEITACFDVVEVVMDPLFITP